MFFVGGGRVLLFELLAGPLEFDRYSSCCGLSHEPENDNNVKKIVNCDDCFEKLLVLLV